VSAVLAPAVERDAARSRDGRCECGGTIARGGECAGCRQRRLARHDRRSAVVPRAGRPLEPRTRSTMERRFGRDFSSVRVHADESAASSARALDADAFTLGPDVVFGAGRYRPGEPAGDRLIAHELAHVAQQQRGGTAAPARPPVAPAGGGLEHEAGRAAALVGAGRAAPPLSAAPAGAVQRQQATTAAPATTGRAAAPADRNRDVDRPGGRRYHARYDDANGVLTITVRIKFDFRESTDQFLSRSRWTQSDKDAWKRDYIAQVHERWSERYVLERQGECAGATNQRVAVVVNPVDADAAGGSPHWTIDVINDSPSGDKSTTYHETARLHYGDVRPSTVNEQNEPVNVGRGERRVFERGEEHVQTTSEHEFGHMLGIHHIACTLSEKECYGRTPEQRDNIMGYGSTVTPGNYSIFADLLGELTGCTWTPRPAGLSGWAIFGIVLGVLAGLALAGLGIAAAAGAFSGGGG
jgi:hypothetical protein